MSSYSYRLKARVPVVATVTDERIFCNSPKGYLLYVQHEDGYKELLEDSDQPASKDNTYTKDAESIWIIEAK